MGAASGAGLGVRARRFSLSSLGLSAGQGPPPVLVSKALLSTAASVPGWWTGAGAAEPTGRAGPALLTVWPFTEEFASPGPQARGQLSTEPFLTLFLPVLHAGRGRAPPRPPRPSLSTHHHPCKAGRSPPLPGCHDGGRGRVRDWPLLNHFRVSHGPTRRHPRKRLPGRRAQCCPLKGAQMSGPRPRPRGCRADLNLGVWPRHQRCLRWRLGRSPATVITDSGVPSPRGWRAQRLLSSGGRRGVRGWALVTRLDHTFGMAGPGLPRALCLPTPQAWTPGPPGRAGWPWALFRLSRLPGWVTTGPTSRGSCGLSSFIYVSSLARSPGHTVGAH